MLNPFETQNYLIASAARGDLTVRWTEDVSPRTDGKVVYLPRIHSKMDATALAGMSYFVAHEVSHIKYSSMNLLKDKNLDPSKSTLAAMTNILEDCRIDHLNADIYEGDRQACDSFFSTHSSSTKMRQRLTDALKSAEPEAAENLRRLVATFLLDATAREAMFPNGSMAQIHELSGVDTTIDNYHRTFVAKGYDKELHRIIAKGESPLLSYEVYELAKKLFDDSGGDSAAEEQRLKELAKEKGECDGESDKKEGGKPDKGEGPGKSSSKKGKIEVDYSEWLPHNNKEHSSDFRQDIRLNYDKHAGGGNYVPSERVAVMDYAKKIGINCSYESPDGGGYRRNVASEAAEMCSNGDGFASRVRSLLQVRARGRTEYGTKTGKIHKAAVHRVLLKDSHLGDKIFKRKINSDVLDTAVSILVDISGSMSGDKVVHAAAGAALLQHTLGNTLHIPTEVTGFSDAAHGGRDHYGYVLNMYVYRDFNTPILSNDDFLSRIGKSCDHMHNNPDGEALMWVHSRLMSRREKRKLLIVLSDGSPACGRTGDIVGYTKQVSEHIARTPVEIVGIGIMDENVRKFYKENYVIQHADELETAMLNVIKRKVF